MYFRLIKTILIAYFGLTSCTNKTKSETVGKKTLAQGEDLFNSSGCNMCHSLENKQMYGPSLHNILGTKVKVIKNNKEQWVTIDEKYIYRSIKNPESEKVLEFKGKKMPVPTLSDDDIRNISAYVIHLNKQHFNKEKDN